MRIGEVGELYAGPVAASTMIPPSRPPAPPRRVDEDEKVPPVKGIAETTLMVDMNSRKRGYRSNKRRDDVDQDGQNLDLRA